MLSSRRCASTDENGVWTFRRVCR